MMEWTVLILVCRERDVDCKLWGVECKVWGVECKVYSVKFQVKFERKREVRNVEGSMRIVSFKLWRPKIGFYIWSRPGGRRKTTQILAISTSSNCNLLVVLCCFHCSCPLKPTIFRRGNNDSHSAARLRSWYSSSCQIRRCLLATNWGKKRWTIRWKILIHDILYVFSHHIPMKRRHDNVGIAIS